MAVHAAVYTRPASESDVAAARYSVAVIVGPSAAIACDRGRSYTEDQTFGGTVREGRPCDCDRTASTEHRMV